MIRIRSLNQIFDICRGIFHRIDMKYRHFLLTALTYVDTEKTLTENRSFILRYGSGKQIKV